MKIITESDLLKIVNKVLNEQKNRQFDEDQIELLHWIFERELRPPFRRGEVTKYNDYPYYNSDNKLIGWLNARREFDIRGHSTLLEIKTKICYVFEFPRHTNDWWRIVRPHLKSWLEDRINVTLNYLSYSIDD